MKRSKYVCEKCGKVHYLLDDYLEIGRSKVSKKVCKIASMIFIYSPFEHAQKVLKEALGIHASTTLLMSISKRIGTKLYNDTYKKSRRPEQISSKVEEVELMYIQTDGAMAPIMNQGGVKYKENKLGLVFTDVDIVHKKTKKGEDRVEIKNKHFVSSIGEGVEKFKKMLFVLAKEHGLFKSKKVIVLGDGASWISKMTNEYFPNAIKILDWYHAVDHLWSTAHALYGEKNIERCRHWVEPFKELLWHGKIDTVIKELMVLGNSMKKNQTPIWDLHGYLVSNRDSMKYDEFRKAGYYIGSGAIESANKYIVANRLKQAGMRWNIYNANAMIWLRCKNYEETWDQFWKDMNIADYTCKQEYLWGEQKGA